MLPRRKRNAGPPSPILLRVLPERKRFPKPLSCDSFCLKCIVQLFRRLSFFSERNENSRHTAPERRSRFSTRPGENVPYSNFPKLGNNTSTPSEGFLPRDDTVRIAAKNRTAPSHLYFPVHSRVPSETISVRTSHVGKPHPRIRPVPLATEANRTETPYRTAPRYFSLVRLFPRIRQKETATGRVSARPFFSETVRRKTLTPFPSDRHETRDTGHSKRRTHRSTLPPLPVTRPAGKRGVGEAVSEKQRQHDPETIRLKTGQNFPPAGSGT